MQMFGVQNPNECASEILLNFSGGMDVGWHTYTAAYHAVVIQGKHTHTFKAATPGGPGSVWSQPATELHDDKCEEISDCIVSAYFHGKLDFNPVEGGAKGDH